MAVPSSTRDSRCRPQNLVTSDRRQARVEFALPLHLRLPGGGHAHGDRGGILRIRGHIAQQVLDRQRHQFDVHIDAIDQRAGDSVAIARDLLRGAVAAAAPIAGVAAGAGIHRRDQLESRREIRTCA